MCSNTAAYYAQKPQILWRVYMSCIQFTIKLSAFKTFNFWYSCHTFYGMAHESIFSLSWSLTLLLCTALTLSLCFLCSVFIITDFSFFGGQVKLQTLCSSILGVLVEWQIVLLTEYLYNKEWSNFIRSNPGMQSYDWDLVENWAADKSSDWDTIRMGNTRPKESG